MQITAEPPLTQANLAMVIGTPVFKDWVNEVESDDKLFIGQIHIQGVDMFGPRIGARYRKPMRTVCSSCDPPPPAPRCMHGGKGAAAPVCTGFLKFKARALVDIGGSEGDDGVIEVPGIVFMRGGAVGVLVILECEGQEYTILTYQVPAQLLQRACAPARGARR